MKTSQKIYAVLKQQFPGYSNAGIGNRIGCGDSMVSKMAKGKTLGLSVAEWLGDTHPEYEYLHLEALAQQKCADKCNGKKKIKKRNPLYSLSPEMQRWAGYLS